VPPLIRSQLALSLRFGLVCAFFRTHSPCPRPLSANAMPLILEVSCHSPMLQRRRLLSPIRRPDRTRRCDPKVARLALTTAVKAGIRKGSTAQAFSRATIAGRTASPSPRSRPALVRVSRREHEKGTTPFRHEKLGSAAAQNRFLPAWIWILLRPAQRQSEEVRQARKRCWINFRPNQGRRAQGCTSSKGSRFRQAAEAMGVTTPQPNRLGARHWPAQGGAGPEGHGPASHLRVPDHSQRPCCGGR